MQIFFADSKCRAQELSNDVSFVRFGHQTWDLEGGGQFDAPPSISWFSSTPAEILLPENAYDLSGSVQAVYVENHAYRCDFTIKNLEKFL